MNKLPFPFTTQGVVRSDWIDFNGHMNGGYYTVAFDVASVAFLEYLGIDAAYRAKTNCSTFILEGHISYFAELKEAERFNVNTYVYNADPKRLHLLHEMFNVAAQRVASMEVVTMHVDLNKRRGCPFPDFINDRIDKIHALHRQYDFCLVGKKAGLAR